MSHPSLGALAREIRRTVLEQARRANVGHIGSALSVADIVAALYGECLRDAVHASRDRFVLSKGHAALALYAALELTGRLPRGTVGTYCDDGSLLGVHPEHGLAGIDFTTGSLGHGLPLAAGAALAARIQRSDRRAYVLLSDAELNEGSTWEAAMFAAHHGLGNLVLVVDVNGQQALGMTADVLDLSNLAERWTAVDWDVVEVDGHDSEAIARSIHRLRGDRPHVLLAQTVSGRGVDYMEGLVQWHYLPMDADQFESAMQQVSG